MKKNLLFGLLVAMSAVTLLSPKTSFATEVENPPAPQNNMITEKKNLGQLLALYPKPITVIGAEVDGKINWLVVGHTGIIGHDRILVSMNQKHHTNHGIKESKKFSINLVSQEMLPKADYVGSVTGSVADKSKAFEYKLGANGTPIINEAPVSMECNVVDSFESEGFDNFICAIAKTYADPKVLDENGKLDYTKLKPVLFEFPTYLYLATGEVLGKPFNLTKEPSMVAKLPMQEDGIVRLSRIEIFTEYLDEYLKFASEVGEKSLRTEPGVLTMYAVQEKENPNIVTILEIYASRKAYESHIQTEHFQKYKKGTVHMVKDLKLVDQHPINPSNQLKNFVQ
ncbi:MAG: flavin reductase [Burkholderiales bacterium]|nr:flavin reductase [Burkholderiales bacterium]